jgi:tetratricopeptide (TPR) repeat protein
MYSQALDLLYDRGTKRGNENGDEHLHLIRKQAMIVGLGFGWINMTRGFLGRAENALTTARSMLASVDDPLISSYVGLLYGTIRRCRAGTNKEKLKEAIDELQRIRRSFMNHPRYQARTCWELAQAKLLIDDLPGAENDLRVVATMASQTLNRKWQINVKILESRILRKQGDFEDARTVADTAVNMAQSPDCNTTLPLVDALLTRGEAYLSLAVNADKVESYHSKAAADFNDALQIMFARPKVSGRADYLSNPKIAGVCSLRLAQCYARMGNQPIAKRHLAIWVRLEPHVEHEWVRELAAQVKSEIDKLSMDFMISAQEPHKWNYPETVNKLRHWLLTQALRETNWNYSEAARLIGVQRATLYQWQNQQDLISGSKKSNSKTSKSAFKGIDKKNIH